MTYYLEFMAVRASATLRRQPGRIDLARGAFEKFVQLSVATAKLVPTVCHVPCSSQVTASYESAEVGFGAAVTAAATVGFKENRLPRLLSIPSQELSAGVVVGQRQR